MHFVCKKMQNYFGGKEKMLYICNCIDGFVKIQTCFS